MSVINLFDKEHMKKIKQELDHSKDLKKSDIERIDEFRGIVSSGELYAFFADKIYEDVTSKLESMRQGDCNKGTFGTLGCICGSYGMAGAAMLCSSAAYAGGAGIVKCIIPENIYPIMAGQVWEAVYTPLPASDDGTLRYSDIDRILAHANSCTAIVLGCGIKVTEDTEKIVCELLREYKKPVILDADGINCLSKHIDVLKERTAPMILTPHPKEMSRLLGGVSVPDIQKDREKTAKDFAREYGCIIALKGSGTVISDGNKTIVNPTGNGALSKGGTGDVLAGITGAFVCQGIDLFDACAAAVYAHGYAADIICHEVSPVGVTASDIISILKLL